MEVLTFLLFTTLGRLLCSLTVGFFMVYLMLRFLSLLYELTSFTTLGKSEPTSDYTDPNEHNYERRRCCSEEKKHPIPDVRRVSAQEILGVPETATRKEAKDAFRQHLKLYHPDRVSGMPPEVQHLANDLTRRVKDAYESLLKDLPA